MKNMKSHFSVSKCFCLKSIFLNSVLLALVSPALGDELADKGRAIFTKNHLSVVTVQLVLKSKVSVPGMGGQSNESRQDATGTILDPSGLTVLSLSNTDPGPAKQPNWLPAPDGPFYAVFRVYLPGDTVLDGTWKKPPMQPVAR